MPRFKPRNEEQERWLAETADALACAERLAARLIELRGSADIGPVLAIQAEIAVLRNRVDQRFDAVIQEARNIVAMKTLTIGEGGDIVPGKREVLSVPTTTEALFTGVKPGLPGRVQEDQAAYQLPTPEQVAVADTTLAFIRDKYERTLPGGLADLRKADVQAAIARDVRTATQAAQGRFESIAPQAEIEKLVAEIAASIADNSIEIP